jgi:hypothetical protein
MTEQNTQNISNAEITETKKTNWLDEELKNTKTSSTDFEKLESLKLEVGKIVKFTVDFSQPFKKWNKVENGKTSTKAIIPVVHKEVKKNLWLNVKNPLYGQLCEAGQTGQTEFRVSTSGTQAETRYAIVEED